MKKLMIALLGLGLMCANAYAVENKPMYLDAAGTGSNAQQQEAAKNLKEGQTFLDLNKQKPGVVTLPSGLQYKVIKQGSGGANPQISDYVTVDYEGTLINGKVFDSSYARGKSVSFGVSDVIPGWTEALKLMTPDAVWMVYIPSSLAYGAEGSPPSIGPNETLIFKIHLISINNT